jgi:hypothetical protein
MARARRVVIVVGGFIVMTALLWLIVKVVPEQLATGGINDPSQRDQAIGRTRTGVLAILAGGLAGIGAYYTHRTFGLTQQGQITERFTRAVDQLGNQSLDVRLGGIYALERLARESRNDQGPIIEVLTAYIRVRTPLGAEDQVDVEDPLREDLPCKQLRIDIQAALTVVGRRTHAHDPPEPWIVDLHDAHLEGADLSNAHLEGANLNGSVFDGGAPRTSQSEHAHLEGATLAGAYLEEAALYGAYLGGAALHLANLDKASLNGACLRDATLHGARLTDADLRGAQLEGARLFEAQLEGARLRNATWSDATEWPEMFDPTAPGTDKDLPG